jgi:hypothetical protein
MIAAWLRNSQGSVPDPLDKHLSESHPVVVLGASFPPKDEPSTQVSPFRPYALSVRRREGGSVVIGNSSAQSPDVLMQAASAGKEWLAGSFPEGDEERSPKREGGSEAGELEAVSAEQLQDAEGEDEAINDSHYVRAILHYLNGNCVHSCSPI